MNTEGRTIAGAYKLGNVPAALFKYDKDKDYAGAIVYIQREIAALTYLVRTMFPKRKVFSHEPTLPEVQERIYKFFLAGAGPSGSSGVMVQTLKFANDDAKGLQRDDFLANTAVFHNTTPSTNTWTSTYAYDAGSPEMIRILEVHAADSAGAGETNIVVQRGWGGNGTGTPTQIATTMALVLGTSATGEASRSRIAVGKNLTTDNNYVQLFREPYEATDFEMDEDFFFNERPEQTNANLASLLLLKKIEFTHWIGRKHKVVDTVTGKSLYTTGGIAEWIPNDAAHRINYNGVITSTGMNSVLKDVFLLGGSNEKWMFTGYSFNTALNNAYDQKVRLNMPYSDKYKLSISTLEQSIGGVVHIVPSFALTELGFDWHAFVLDLGNPATPFFQYMFMEDIYINTGRDGKGIQANDEFTRKEEFVGKIGLIRRAKQYQAHIYGVTQSL